MPTLLESCENFYGTRDLYQLLKIPKTASDDEVKKAYRKLSLIVHPDRVSEEEKDEATEKFKILGKIHSVLTDTEKRAVYDETGCVDEEDDCDLRDKDWSAYWRLLFKEITMDDIKEYEKEYKGSQEEIEDLKDAYEKGKGNMDVIFDSVPFTTLSEESRIREILEGLIEKGELESYEEFASEDPKKKQRRKRRLEKEAKEAQKAKKELEKKRNSRQKENVEDIEEDEDVEEVESDVMKAILKRKKEREAQADSFFNHLVAKYGNENKKTKQKRSKK